VRQLDPCELPELVAVEAVGGPAACPGRIEDNVLPAGPAGQA
jgi:hypothetical protein